MYLYKLFFLMLIVFSISSCGNSLESDATKLGSLGCKIDNMRKQDKPNYDEIKKLDEEFDKLTAEFKKKYSSEEQEKKFSAVFMEAYAKCDEKNK
jgi:hypothetical protein